MIVVEGPDGAGKSTLVRNICSGAGLLEADPLTKEERKHMDRTTRRRTYQALATCVKGDKPVTVYDRWYLSELVYGPIWRGYCEFNAHEQEFIKNVAFAMQFPIILCMPPLDACINNIAKDEHTHEKVRGTIESIYVSYMKFARPTSHFNTLVYDYTRDDGSRVDNVINNYMDKRKERTWDHS